MSWGIRPRGCRAPRYCEDDKFTIQMNHGGSLCDNLYVNGSLDFIDFCDKDQMSMFEIGLMVKELGYDGIVLYHYEFPNSASVEKLMSDEDVLKMCECVPGPTNAKVKIVKIVEQEPVEDVGDFSEPEAPKGKTVAEAAKNGKAARSSKDKEVAEPEPPKSVRATRFSKGKEVAEPEPPKRARAIRSSKGKGVAMASATEGEDSDASLSDASTFINEGEGGAVNQDGVVNKGESPIGDEPLHAGPSGDHPSQAGPSGDHPSQTGQNEDQPSQTGQNREQPSLTADVHHTDLEDTRLEEGDQAVENELRSVHSDEDDETVAWGEKFKHYNHETDKQNPVFDTGMIFMSCPWQIYAAWKNPTYRSLVVKYYNLNHNCVRVFENTQASSKWLTKKFLPRIQSNPSMPPQSTVNAASSEFKVGISRMKAYRAKADALRMIKGSVAEQYAMLWDYCHELEDKNPGSTTKMQCEFVDGETIFKCFYICLEPLKRGFKMNCRPFIGLDACHLKGVYGGQLLTAVGINPNNEIWVLAYAVVEMETRESWTWFIDLLAKDVDIVNSHGWAFISDKQKGLPGAFEDIVPNAEIRFCVRHL
ncbi:unnamed protein product [Prunus brigantina]